MDHWGENESVLAEDNFEDPGEEVLRQREREEAVAQAAGVPAPQIPAHEQLPVQLVGAAPAAAPPGPQPWPHLQPAQGLVQRQQLQGQLHELTCRRHSSKSPPTAADLSRDRAMASPHALLSEALAAEGLDDLPLLPATVKRKHIHWTHVRTHEPWVQPCEMTRAPFWKHLEVCYKECYPCDGSETGSILGFGKVVSEMHAAGKRAADRDPHKHAACFCTAQHYWNKVAKLSRDKYRVPLNAVAHDGYADMFAYVSQPSAKKPLHELDAEPFLSPAHPRGEALRALLLASANSAKQLQGRSRPADAAARLTKRPRAPDIFELVQAKQFKSVLALQAHAHTEAAAGRPALAEFCTRQGPKLEMLLQKAWDVLDAPERMRLKSMSLVDKLAHAAVSLQCCCQGRWAPGAANLLGNNGHDPAAFCAAVRRALQVGARRGVNVACYGQGGCGKSALLEPLEQIFAAMPKPQRGSTFSFTGLVDCDIILWQDYEHHEDTLCFTDLLSTLCGESFGLRVPGCANAKCRNVAPAFYSGRTPIRATHRDPVAKAELNGMMDERFQEFHCSAPMPKHLRQADWPACGRCAAEFYLNGPAARAPPSMLPADASAACGGPSAGPGPAAAATMAEALAKVSSLRASGFLSAAEFQAAKRRLIG